MCLIVKSNNLIYKLLCTTLHISRKECVIAMIILLTFKSTAIYILLNFKTTFSILILFLYLIYIHCQMKYVSQLKLEWK